MRRLIVAAFHYLSDPDSLLAPTGPINDRLALSA
jgi:hypothetical protein